jgi:hypothetical protein
VPFRDRNGLPEHAAEVVDRHSTDRFGRTAGFNLELPTQVAEPAVPAEHPLAATHDHSSQRS